MKKKPNFLIIGAAKSGTTTLHQVLKKHPDIFLAEEKDFKFFDRDENYEKGWGWYNHYFRKYDGQKIIGEANSAYLYSKKAAERIKKDLGEDVKLLAIIRNPVERSFSEFLHQQRYGSAKGELEEYFQKTQTDKDQRVNSLHDKIIDRSLYSKHIQNYLEVFPKKNLEIVFLEKLKESTKEEINKICSFLGVEEMQVEKLIQANKVYSPKRKWLNNWIHQPNPVFRSLIPSFKLRQKIKNGIRMLNSNSKTEKPKITTIQKEKLQLLFKEEKQKLEFILGVHLDEWN